MCYTETWVRVRVRVNPNPKISASVKTNLLLIAGSSLNTCPLENFFVLFCFKRFLKTCIINWNMHFSLPF